MRVYQLINRLVESFNKWSRVLILTPYYRSFGNCAEEIYWGLLKARREGKKALFLYPVPLFWKFCPELANRELFKLQSDFSIPSTSVWCQLAGAALSVIYTLLWRVYALVQRVRGILKHIWPVMAPEPWNNIFHLVPSIGRVTLWKPEDAFRFSWDAVKRMGWKEQYEQPLHLKLPGKKRQEAEALRVAMGIPLESWFVCLHVREGGFYRDWEAGVNRNCSTLNYLESIRAITARGGYVVRLGDANMQRLPIMERVIDYPHTPYKSEFMDLYLISECKFFVGLNSGPYDVARMFQKPSILVNLTEWTNCFPPRKGDLAILKHYYSRSRGRCLSLQELLDEPFGCQLLRRSADDYVMLQNTSNEIRDVILEFLAIEGEYQYSDLQRWFNEGRVAQIHRWLNNPEPLFSSDAIEETVERFRWAAHCEAFTGAIGRTYLEANWSRDATMPESR
jgi:putative glycosyltransferase (TIGR04372 family)